MVKKYVDSQTLQPCVITEHFQNHKSAAITSSTLLERLSTGVCNLAAGICSHPATTVQSVRVPVLVDKAWLAVGIPVHRSVHILKDSKILSVGTTLFSIIF